MPCQSNSRWGQLGISSVIHPIDWYPTSKHVLWINTGKQNRELRDVTVPAHSIRQSAFAQLTEVPAALKIRKQLCSGEFHFLGSRWERTNQMKEQDGWCACARSRAPPESLHLSCLSPVYFPHSSTVVHFYSCFAVALCRTIHHLYFSISISSSECLPSLQSLPPTYSCASSFVYAFDNVCITIP